MAQYKVLRPIELGGKLYFPEGIPTFAGMTAAGKKGLLARSAGNGAWVPVDLSGMIELTPEEAAAMTLGQVQPIPTVPEKKKR